MGRKKYFGLSEQRKIIESLGSLCSDDAGTFVSNYYSTGEGHRYFVACANKFLSKEWSMLDLTSRLRIPSGYIKRLLKNAYTTEFYDVFKFYHEKHKQNEVSKAQMCERLGISSDEIDCIIQELYLTRDREIFVNAYNDFLNGRWYAKDALAYQLGVTLPVLHKITSTYLNENLDIAYQYLEYYLRGDINKQWLAAELAISMDEAASIMHECMKKRIWEEYDALNSDKTTVIEWERINVEELGQRLGCTRPKLKELKTAEEECWSFVKRRIRREMELELRVY